MVGVEMDKRVMLLFIDSLMPDVLERASGKGLVPALDFLRNRGAYWNECVTVFPTMSASVDGSLLTGTYPDIHKLPGIVWYNRKENKVINYVNGTGGVLKLGINRCAKDIVYGMNEVHLSKEIKTLYEELEERGILTSSVNCMIHRGPHRYEFNLPGMLNLVLFRMEIPYMQGPEKFAMGKFARTLLLEGVKWKWNQSIFRKYGFNDAFAVDVVEHMVQSNQMPQFTIVYFPDNDYAYHRFPDQGPEILGKVDHQVDRLLKSFGSWEEALETCTFIVTGDHGQSTIGFDADATVDLEPLFHGIKLANLKNVDTNKDDLVVCNNERMTYLYPLKEGVLEDVVARLCTDPRIDVIAWKERNGVRLQSAKNRLFFAPGEGYVDPYGRQWRVEGEPFLDVILREGQVSFGDYPDLFSRLYGGLYAHEGQVMVLTTLPGYEFYTKGDPIHRSGASHGALHRRDSIVPLIITGEQQEAFQHPRLVDLKGYIMKKLIHRDRDEE